MHLDNIYQLQNLKNFYIFISIRACIFLIDIGVYFDDRKSDRTPASSSTLAKLTIKQANVSWQVDGFWRKTEYTLCLGTIAKQSWFLSYQHTNFFAML